MRGTIANPGPERARAVLAATAAGAWLAVAAAQPESPFEPAQPDLVRGPNAYANAWADWDNDGDDDLAVSLRTGEVRLYRNERGVLERAGGVGLPREGSPEIRGLSWGDFDADGDVDLLGGATSVDHVTGVFRNDGGGRFTDVAARVGLLVPHRSARQTNWVDYDNDGDLDVYAANRAGPNALYRNDGGSFVRVHESAGPSDPRPTVGACWFDLDEDGDLDLYLANQAGASDAMWRNDGGGFTDVAPALGLTGPRRTTAEGGVGCAVGDYDNDGDLDVFTASYGRNLLYRNDHDGTFTEVGREVGVGVENHAVGADWGDWDNDGDLDLAVAAYEGAPGAQTPLDALFRNDGVAGFVNAIAKESPLNAADHGVQLVDYDRDGGLDMSMTDGYGASGGHFLFRSTLAGEARRRGLNVLVVDSRGHHTRFGAEVRVFDRAGRLLATRLVAAGGGYNTQSARPVHFGLRSTAPVRVEATFMTAAGRRTVGVDGVDPARYRGRSLVVRQR